MYTITIVSEELYEQKMEINVGLGYNDLNATYANEYVDIYPIIFSRTSITMPI